ncbi:hypothetical protein HQQ80_10040 [Microbacteriaceae bacterium VKM Ac-2855]|nr:hypothetical protein [Microbacteriaceae bacterium VKM Ac-2855]
MVGRRLLPVVVLTAVLALAGCGQAGSIDIPAGAGESSVPAPTDAETPESAAPETTAAEATTPTAEPEPTVAGPATIDCAATLPVQEIESDLDLPEDFVTLTDGSGAGTCSYTIAGNGSAIQIAWRSTTETSAALSTEWTDNGATAIDFGEAAALQLPTDATAVAGQPAALQVLASGIQVSVFTYVGGRGELESYAQAIYAALGITV